ncbi:MAG TPA: D-arabinono-1,4-lactone oxidase [Puia sp.]|nr:D-arabinono-1,4-lactone oxidase [Puia sp.]
MSDISDIATLPVNGVDYFLPASEDDVIRLVNDAKENNEIICVRGAAHSFPLLDTLEATKVSKAGRNYKYLLLSRMNTVTITGNTAVAQAGCHLGYDPFDPDKKSTLENSLIYQLFKANLAVGDLGGISHQTVGGFLSTGSSGGSTTYAFEESLISLDIIICGNNGAEKVTYKRPSDNNSNDPFFAVGLAGLGLMGVIVSATFQCIPTFNILGTEVTTKCDDCEIDLFGPGVTSPIPKLSMQGFLEATEYTRIIWWPQKNVTKSVVWKCHRMQASDYDPKVPGRTSPKDFTPKPYEEVDWIDGSPIPETLGADILFTAMGRWPQWFDDLAPDSKWIKDGVEFAFPYLFPLICDLFVSIGTKIFWDYWYSGLPMDDQMGDKIMPVWFTELWIPIEQSQAVMTALKNYYDADKCFERTGKFCVEIYAAKKSDFWFSPAYDQDVIRIDIFWFANNIGDPAAYFQQFWDLLKPFNFRPHWGKYFPDPSTASAGEPSPTFPWKGYLKSQYSKWDDWMNLRNQNDPGKIFVNDYWGNKLEI